MRYAWMVCALVACNSNSPAKVIERYKAEATSREADFAAIAKMLAGHAASDPPAVDPPAIFDGDKQNAFVIDQDQLLHDRRDGSKGPHALGFGQLNFWRDAIDVAKTGNAGNRDADRTERLLRELVNLRYVLVLVTRELVEPKLTGDGNALSEEFIRGRWRGDALLFDLRAHKYLGGWPVAGESGASVTRTGPGPTSSALITDLSTAVYRDINRTLREKLPGVVVPWGYL